MSSRRTGYVFLQLPGVSDVVTCGRYEREVLRDGRVVPIDRDRHAEHFRHERQCQVILDHRVEPPALLGVAVGVDRHFGDQFLQAGS